MTDRELEQKLADAVDRAAPNDLEAILSRCGAQNGSVMNVKTLKRHRHLLHLQYLRVQGLQLWSADH